MAPFMDELTQYTRICLHPKVSDPTTQLYVKHTAIKNVYRLAGKYISSPLDDPGAVDESNLKGDMRYKYVRCGVLRTDATVVVYVSKPWNTSGTLYLRLADKTFSAHSSETSVRDRVLYDQEIFEKFRQHVDDKTQEVSFHASDTEENEYREARDEALRDLCMKEFWGAEGEASKPEKRAAGGDVDDDSWNPPSMKLLKK